MSQAEKKLPLFWRSAVISATITLSGFPRPSHILSLMPMPSIFSLMLIKDSSRTHITENFYFALLLSRNLVHLQTLAFNDGFKNKSPSSCYEKWLCLEMKVCHAVLLSHTHHFTLNPKCDKDYHFNFTDPAFTQLT